MNYDNTMEEWRPIPDCSGYEASNLGRIRSIDRTIHCKDDTLRLRRGVILKQCLGGAMGRRTRHMLVSINRRTVLVHALVAAAFIGPRPPGKQVAHNDGDSLNNAAINLRYATPKQNQQDMIDHGNSQRGTKNVGNKLLPQQVLEIRSLIGTQTQKAIAKKFEISPTVIYQIKTNRTWGWL
jgi:hypothetical protein